MNTGQGIEADIYGIFSHSDHEGNKLHGPGLEAHTLHTHSFWTLEALLCCLSVTCAVSISHIMSAISLIFDWADEEHTHTAIVQNCTEWGWG